MFTAIHELAHHVMFAEKGNKSACAHTQDFWAAFHSILDIAGKKGVYRVEIDTDTQKLIDDARAISGRVVGLWRELGRVILAIEESCRENGLRAEDIIERKAQIGKQSSKVAVAAYNMGDQGVGVDIQAEAAKQRDEYKRAAVIAAGHEGKTLFIRKHFHGSRATIIAAGHEGKSVVQRKHFHSS